jgi:hypothetical protein
VEQPFEMTLSVEDIKARGYNLDLGDRFGVSAAVAA